jgi:hypothetical protein
MPSFVLFSSYYEPYDTLFLRVEMNRIFCCLSSVVTINNLPLARKKDGWNWVERGERRENSASQYVNLIAQRAEAV